MKQKYEPMNTKTVITFQKLFCYIRRTIQVDYYYSTKNIHLKIHVFYFLRNKMGKKLNVLKKNNSSRLCCWSVACKKKQQLFVTTAELGLKRIVWITIISMNAEPERNKTLLLLFLTSFSATFVAPKAAASDRSHECIHHMHTLTHTLVDRLHTVGLWSLKPLRMTIGISLVLKSPISFVRVFFVFHLGLVISFSFVALARRIREICNDAPFGDHKKKKHKNTIDILSPKTKLRSNKNLPV